MSCLVWSEVHGIVTLRVNLVAIAVYEVMDSVTTQVVAIEVAEGRAYTITWHFVHRAHS